jgi:hypothetical protein
MEPGSTLADALLAAGTVALFVRGLFYLLYRTPDFRTVQEAKRLKNREDDDSGDPPDLDVDEFPADSTHGPRR